MDMKAKEWIERALRDCTPPHIPVPYNRILAARFLAKKQKTAVGSLEMIDGLKGYIAVSTWADFTGAWTVQWHEMEGGALYWDGSEWKRESNYIEVNGQLEMAI